MMNKENRFDCVEMKHRAAARIQKDLKGKSVEERIAYWNEEYRKQKESCAVIEQKAKD